MRVAAKAAEGDGALLGLLAADDDDDRHMLDTMFADFGVDFLVGEVGFDRESGLAEGRRDLLGVGVGIRHDGCHHDLNRGQPERKAAGILFDGDAEEPFEAPGEAPGATLLESWSLSWPSVTTTSPAWSPALKPTLFPAVWAIVTGRILAVLPFETA